MKIVRLAFTTVGTVAGCYGLFTLKGLVEEYLQGPPDPRACLPVCRIYVGFVWGEEIPTFAFAASAIALVLLIAGGFYASIRPRVGFSLTSSGFLSYFLASLLLLPHAARWNRDLETMVWRTGGWIWLPLAFIFLIAALTCRSKKGVRVRERLLPASDF